MGTRRGIWRSKAQLLVADCYFEGVGVPLDRDKALQYLRSAAEYGLMIAQFWLASCYRSGKGVEVDLAESRRWMRLVAERPEKSRCVCTAKLFLGRLYSLGEEAVVDLDESIKWYEEAMQHDFVDVAKIETIISDIKRKRRFSDNGDNTVTDNKHGLVWIKNPSQLGGEFSEFGKILEMEWTDAVRACKSLTYAGYSDWRLPSVTEFQSLFDQVNADNPADVIDPADVLSKDFFSEWYWTRTKKKGDDSDRWSIWLSDQDLKGHPVDWTESAWPVRSVSDPCSKIDAEASDAAPFDIQSSTTPPPSVQPAIAPSSWPASMIGQSTRSEPSWLVTDSEFAEATRQFWLSGNANGFAPNYESIARQQPQNEFLRDILNAARFISDYGFPFFKNEALVGWSDTMRLTSYRLILTLRLMEEVNSGRLVVLPSEVCCFPLKDIQHYSFKGEAGTLRGKLLGSKVELRGPWGTHQWMARDLRQFPMEQFPIEGLKFPTESFVNSLRLMATWTSLPKLAQKALGSRRTEIKM